MSADRIRTWTLGRIVVHWHTREGRLPSLPLVDVDVVLGCWRCYCKTGLNVCLHSFNQWRWLSIDWTKRPCPCDDAIAELENAA